MTKRETAKANEVAAKLFADEAADLQRKYDNLLKNCTKKGYQERHCRRQAIQEIRRLQADSLYVDKHEDLGQNDLLIMMYTQYEEAILDWFGTEEHRVVEWFESGWPNFLQQHYFNNREDHLGCQVVALWSFDEVCRFLAFQFAHRQVERQHESRMNELWRLATATVTESQTDEQGSGKDTESEGAVSSHQLGTAPISEPIVDTKSPVDPIPAEPSGSIDRVDISIDDRLMAAMLLRIMLHVGYAESEVSPTRLGRLMAYLRNDTSKEKQESCRKAVGYAIQLYKAAEEGDGQAHIGQMSALKLWLHHFTKSSTDSTSAFMTYLEDEILEVERNMY